jgi:hypothetical protein
LNIFALSTNQRRAAQYHVNAHVISQIKEYAQLLSSVHHVYPTEHTPHVYKMGSAWFNHPSTIWVRQSKANYSWLVALWHNLYDEKLRRWPNAAKGHASYEDNVARLVNVPPNMPDVGLTPVSLAMPARFQRPCATMADAVECYRDYYAFDESKTHLHAWHGRCPPPWLTQRQEQSNASV